jgi:hypothetical protein
MPNLKLASLALPIVLAACGEPKIYVAPQPDHPGQMTVSGQASIDISPDCADLTMTLSSDDAKPGAATTSVQQKERALVDALEHLGVGNGELKLSTMTLEPIYEPNPDGWAQIKVHTYRASIVVTATTKKFDQIGPIMDAGAQAGAGAMSSQFRRSDLSDLKKKVRAMALQAARDKAAQTADALGIKLGRITTVSENGGGQMWNQAYFPTVANAAAVQNSGVALGGTLQTITLDVNVGYELARET